MEPGVAASVAALVPQDVAAGVGRVALLGGYAAFFLVVLYASYLKMQALYGYDDADTPAMVNCSSCGARTRRDDEACQYCGDAPDQ